MGLPSGTMWARKNMDASRPDHFAESDIQYSCSYVSWANVDPHNPVSDESFGDWSWGDSNAGEPYVSSPGHFVTTEIDNAHDAARNVCGAPWRMPSSDDYRELINPSFTDFIDAEGVVIDPSVEDKRIVIDGVRGIRIRSKANGNILFFACCGYAKNSILEHIGDNGYYWCRDLFSEITGYCFYIGTNTTPLFGNSRFRGVPVRPVMKL